MSSKLQSDVHYLGRGWRHPVNVYEVKAGRLLLFVEVASKTVLSL